MSAKIPLYHDTAHTQPRSALGVPQDVPALPTATSTAGDVLAFSTARIAHVSQTTGETDHVHLFATSTVDTHVYVEVLQPAAITSAGATDRAADWPALSRAMRIRLRANQPSPLILVQGYTIAAGAALSVYADAVGAKFFGFVVQDPAP